MGSGRNDPSEAGAEASEPGTGLVPHVRWLLWRAGPSTTVVALLVALATRRYLPIANADALLPALMSTQRWTLFYWGQDRLANLVPLLAMPIRDPDWNLRFQTMLIAGAFFAVAAAFVSYHYWSSGHRPHPLQHASATLLTGLACMAPLQVLAGYRFLVEQLYFVTVLLFIGALYCWTRRRWFLPGAALAVVALLVNPSLLLATPFVWLVDVEATGRVRRTVWFTAVMLTGFLITNVASRTFASGLSVDGGYGDFSVERLSTGLRRVAGRIGDSVDLPMAVLVIAGSVTIVALTWHRLAVRARLVHVALPAFAALWVAMFAANRWVASNAHDFRYFYPVYVWFVMVVAAGSAEAVRRITGSIGRVVRTEDRPGAGKWAMGWLGLAVAAALALAVVATRTTRVDSLENGAAVADRAAAADVSIVIGDYWSVWPIVIAGRADGGHLLGVAYRSQPIAGEIDRFLDREVAAGRGVAAVCAGVDAEACAQQLGGFDGRTWKVEAVISEQPLIVELRPVEVG